MIPAGAVIGVFLAVVWGLHHPALGLLACFALVLLATGTVKFCREIAPALAVRSWPPPRRRPAWEYA